MTIHSDQGQGMPGSGTDGFGGIGSAPDRTLMSRGQMEIFGSDRTLIAGGKISTVANS